MKSISEEWKAVPGFEGWYEVSSLGKVRSVDRVVNYKDSSKAQKKGKILRPKVGKHGYLEVILVMNGYRKTSRVHRLVATSFIANPNNLPSINHINEDKLDNRVENLEWCSVKQNTLYSMREIPIGQYDLDGNLIATFNHYTEAGESVGGNKHGVYKCCKGKLKTYKGYVWRNL